MKELLQEFSLKQFFVHVFNTMQDAIFIADDQYKFVYVNEAACKHYGFS